jgi:hypothetical protein
MNRVENGTEIKILLIKILELNKKERKKERTSKVK